MFEVLNISLFPEATGRNFTGLTEFGRESHHIWQGLINRFQDLGAILTHMEIVKAIHGGDAPEPHEDFMAGEGEFLQELERNKKYRDEL